jgi:PAS domain S-box-containing protein
MSINKVGPEFGSPAAITECREFASEHSVQFYSEDSALIDELGRFIGSALQSGDAAIVIATEPHRQQLAQRLKDRGLDVAEALQQGRYVELDAVNTLSRFMQNGRPDATRFTAAMGDLIERTRAAAGEDRQVAAFGEMVDLLFTEGKAEAAIRLEQLWNDVSQAHGLYLRCAYSMRSFGDSEQSEAMLRICGEHSHVIPAEEYAEVSPEKHPARKIAHPQRDTRPLATDPNGAGKATTMLAAIVESCDDAVASKDLNGIVTSWNASAERIFGYKADEIVGRPITLIIPPELHQDEQRILDKILAGERLEHFETVRLTKSGRRIHVSLTISPVKDATGRVIGAAKVARDITERKNTEEALRRAEKLAATGQLAATIAHEINNPMQALTNLLSLLSYKSSLDEDTRRVLSLAEAEVNRMAHITRQMLSFYRESSVPVRTKISEMMEDILALFVTRLRSNHIRVERRYEFAEEIEAFPMELRQLFANLLANAMEAIGKGGQIHLHVVPAHEWSNLQRRGVRVVIADNGPGISRDLRKRLFEPFFTTKAEKGTGLGLWVARGIVAKHGGSIRWRSSTRPGRSGTVFSVFLPITIPVP